MFVRLLLQNAVELRQRHYRSVEYLGQGFKVRDVSEVEKSVEKYDGVEINTVFGIVSIEYWERPRVVEFCLS